MTDRHIISAREALLSEGDHRRNPVGGQMGSDFYRRHDTMGYIPTEAQSVRSQAAYSAGLPMVMGGDGGFGVGGSSAYGGPYSSYTPSVISQAMHTQDTQSVRDDLSSLAGSISYTQSDRLHRQQEMNRGGPARGGERQVRPGSPVSQISDAISDYKSQDARDDDDIGTQYSVSTATTYY